MSFGISQHLLYFLLASASLKKITLASCKAKHQITYTEIASCLLRSVFPFPHLARFLNFSWTHGHPERRHFWVSHQPGVAMWLNSKPKDCFLILHPTVWTVDTIGEVKRCSRPLGWWSEWERGLRTGDQDSRASGLHRVWPSISLGFLPLCSAVNWF